MLPNANAMPFISLRLAKLNVMMLLSSVPPVLYSIFLPLCVRHLAPRQLRNIAARHLVYLNTQELWRWGKELCGLRTVRRR